MKKFFSRFCKKKRILVSFLVISACFSIFPLAAEDWVLGAQEFKFKQPKKNPESVAQAAKVLPQLILEQISSGELRNLPESEILDRKLDELLKKRQELFLQLSKENLSRDGIVLKTLKPKELEKKLVEAENKIREIEEKIRENLDEVQKSIDESSPKIKLEKGLAVNNAEPAKGEGERRFPFPFFRQSNENQIVTEKVSVYRNDTSSLFSASAAVLEEGYESRNFSKAVTDAKINGLITGSIVSYGEYAAITVNLYIYPGAKIAGAVTEVGLLSDLMPLAMLIAQNLESKIANSLPILLEFEIQPPEILENAVVSIDGIVYQFSRERMNSRRIIISSGIHTISVEAVGYEKSSMTYQFTGENRFDVKISLVPKIEGKVNLRLKKYRDGIFYANGLDSAEVSDKNPVASFFVNGKAVLGIFSQTVPDVNGEDKEIFAFYKIPAGLVTESENLIVNATPFDRAENIDKRRRMMYTAYTVTVCSLPFTFYTLGNYTAAANAYNLDRNVSYEDAIGWEKARNICVGVTAVCGTWLVVELIRYLHAANQILPVNAKIDKNYEEIIIQSEAEKDSSESLIDSSADDVNNGKSDEKVSENNPVDSSDNQEEGAVKK